MHHGQDRAEGLVALEVFCALDEERFLALGHGFHVGDDFVDDFGFDGLVPLGEDFFERHGLEARGAEVYVVWQTERRGLSAG